MQKRRSKLIGWGDQGIKIKNLHTIKKWTETVSVIQSPPGETWTRLLFSPIPRQRLLKSKGEVNFSSILISECAGNEQIFEQQVLQQKV